MNLKTIKEFCELAGVKKAAISRIQGKLVKYYRDGNTKPIQIDIDDPLNDAYIKSMNSSRLNAVVDKMIPQVGSENPAAFVPSADLIGSAESFADEKVKKIKEEVKKLKTQNKHLEAQYLEKDVIYQGGILYFDRFHSTIDRFFGVIVDDIGPKILASGEITTEILQQSIDEGHKIVDDAKVEFLKLIRDIIKDIENKK